MKTLHQALVEARALIADKEHWVQGVHATNRDGLECEPLSDNACAWCAEGAIIRTCGGALEPLYREADAILCAAVSKAFPNAFGWPYVSVNDGEVCVPADVTDDFSFAHDCILKVFDAAIAEASHV